MNYVDVFYQSDDGLRLYARDYPGPDDGAPVLLCLPGLTRNSARYRVICPDQRGRGRSARDTDASHYRPDRYVQDMQTLLDLLGIARVVVIGTSLGGLMAMIMMASMSGRVRAVVLNDIGPEVDAQGLARIAGYVGKTAPARNWQEAVDQTRMTNGLAFADYEQRDWQSMARDIYIQEGATPVLDYDPAIAQGMTSGTAAANLWPLFDMIAPRPMLVVRGESSDILSAETLDKMQSRWPQVTTVTVPLRGHAPTLSEPAAHSAIESFLARVEGASAV
jgi:pimeloyl-ACP methyl ester carboxylesterase